VIPVRGHENSVPLVDRFGVEHMRKRQRGLLLKRNARWLAEQIREGLVQQSESRKSRAIHFEPLERRELMAADFFEITGVASGASGFGQVATSGFVSSSAGFGSMSGSGMQAEGEAAPDSVAFAKALAASGAKLFGADWNATTTQQRALFNEGANYLPYFEVTNPDRTPNSLATQENITIFPTWKFSNGTVSTGLKTLQELSTLSGVAIPSGSDPTLVEIPNQTVLFRSPLHIPVDTYDPNGGPLTVTVESSNPSAVTAEMVTNPKSLRMVVDGFGEMVFRLFADEAPRPVGRIEQLVNSGFYNKTATNKIIFHRVIDNFVIQGGDPTGTGSGGSSLGNFNDQFNVNLQHNRTGILSYAKSTDDTNDSQFFITEGPQRHLDFNHSIWGQLIEGESVRQAISRTSVNQSRPTQEVVINSMEIFNDNRNGLIRLKSQATSGSATITVRVTNSAGRTFTRTFVATAAADTSNGGPFLNDITVPAIAPGQTVTIPLTAQDKEGDGIFFDASRLGTVPYQFNINNTTGQLQVTAPANFSGSFDLSVGVRASNSSSTADLFDTQRLTFQVNAPVTAPTSVDLVAASDSGISDSDNITNAGTMQFVVSGTTTGATVDLKIGDQVVGSAIAAGATTTITTNQIASLGAGTRSIIATQRINNQTSPVSPALNLTFDNTPPVAIPASNLPTQANVGTELRVDLVHPDEGRDLRYTLENAPAGMSIDSQTGLLIWTPTAAQRGPQTATLRISDSAGNSQAQVMAINVADTQLIKVDLQPFSLDGSPLSSLALNQEFNLRVVIQDLRAIPTGGGVFSAYMDLLYDPSKIELVGTSPVIFSDLYGNGQTADTSTPGIIDEVGAFSSLTRGPGTSPQTIFAVSMRAKSAGPAFFSTNAAENTGRRFSVFGQDNAVADERVGFGTRTVNITQNFSAVNDTFSANEDSTNNNINVLANDTIVPGTNTQLTIQSVGTPSQGGTVSIGTNGTSVLYTPKSNFNGVETFTYTVRDQTGATATAIVTMNVQPVNDNPVANPDTITTIRSNDSNVFIDVLSNDTQGPDTGETLRVTAVGTPSQGGTVTIENNGLGLRYTPRNGFVGQETVSYTISDGNGGTASSTVTIQVAPAVPPPTVVGESFTVAEDSAAADYDVLANDTPAATGDTLTVTQVSAANGSATITNNGTRVRYVPNPNFNGTDRVVYTVRSSNGGTANGTMTMTITSVNDAPTAVNDSFTVLSLPNQTVDVLKNDTNVDSGESLIITAVTQPAAGKGTVSISADKKSLLYSAPNTDFTGAVEFQYTLGDGSALTSIGTVALNVVNFVPRDVGVKLLSTSVQGVTMQVTGNNLVGGNSNALVPTYAGNVVKLEDVGPGAYEFSVKPLPFFIPRQSSVVVQSAFSDGDNLSTPIDVGVRDPRFMDLSDFTSSNLRKAFTTAVQPNQTAAWHNGNQDWRNFSNVSVSLNQTATQLTIRTVDNSNVTRQTTLSTSDPKVVLRGQEGQHRLFRIEAAPTDLTFTVVPATSIAANSTSGVSGEGEGSSVTPFTTNRLSPSSVDSAMAAPPVEIEGVIDEVAKGTINQVTLADFRSRL
jgi:cyclophilin family peptidyl-prolyl cis-trans isomerase